MPTIKLLSGSVSRRDADGSLKICRAGDTLSVSAQLAATLHCEAVGEAPTLDELRAQAIAAGVEVKPQWSTTKILKELADRG